MCVREKTYSEADNLCTEMGSRLCTAAELNGAEGDPATCGYDTMFKWSWVSTPPDVCPSTNQSLGMAGGVGSWFSFVPSVLNAYYEIQLRSAHAFDGDTFTIGGMFDARAEMISGLSTDLYFREDGMMLRWNATHIGATVFAHVMSSAVDAAYTMMVLLPPEYSYTRTVASQVSNSFSTSVPLAVQKNGAVMVDLPFGFPFLGLERRQIWVSSFGMILFEEPRAVGSFGGVGSTYSAIMAAAGEYGLDRAGASVTTSQPTATELKVRWHAPLFGSEVFSDLSVVLVGNGSVVIKWSQLDLSGGGSLAHQLVSHMSTASDSGYNIVQTDGQASHVGIDHAINASAMIIYGTRPGEGLDLSGEFVYALNVGGLSGLTAGDATFTRIGEETVGVTMETDALSGDYFGATAQGTGPYAEVIHSDYDSLGGRQNIFEQDTDDNRRLTDVLRSHAILFQADGFSNDRTLSVSLDVQQGSQYRLQLVFGCTSCRGAWTITRGWDVKIDGNIVLDDYIWPHTNSNYDYGATAIRIDLVARSSTVTVDLERVGGLAHNWLLLSAVTLERSRPRTPAVRPPALVGTETAIQLHDDAYIQLPPMTLGGAIAVSAWVQIGTLWDREVGITLFNSFELEGCDSDACRNAVEGNLDRGGWFAIGNDVISGWPIDPSDLWMANAGFDEGTGLFWEGARDEWMMVTVSVSGRDVRVYVGDQQHGAATLSTRLPRMLRRSNYVGAAHHAPSQQKARGMTIAIADFRLYDRSLSANEVAALFHDPASECCISAGLKGAFGADDLDVSAQAAGATAVTITPSEHAGTNEMNEDTAAQRCVTHVAASDATQEVDMCTGELTTLSDCSGIITDGIGPYANSLTCSLRLEGLIGSTYTLTSDSFATQSGYDFLTVYDGPSSNAPVLARVSGLFFDRIVSTGRALFLHFHTDGSIPDDGFRVSFSCTGTPTEYWKPADVAMPLKIAEVSEPVVQADASTKCLSNILMSVQCCADSTISCEKARVTEIGLSAQSPGLRGTVPEAIGRLGALRSLKLHDNFLKGTLPAGLSRLHLLRDLQLSHNQFGMQERESLAAILGGLLYLETLDIGMSNEEPRPDKTVLHPIPPLACRVGDECSLTLVTRTHDGAPVPHGGVQMAVRKIGSDVKCDCADQMNGSYVCAFPSSWTASRGEFDFSLAADGAEFVPLRTLVDPTSGTETVVEAYGRLGVLVPPMECPQAHSDPNEEGAECVCETGYYRNEYEGGWECSHCGRGEEPIDQGARCESCRPGLYSSSGQRCVPCNPGQHPNLDIGGADSCEPCDSHSFSVSGSICEPCPIGQVADDLVNRTSCICPRGTYNSSVFAGNEVQCLGKHHRSAAVRKKTTSQCVSCSELDCLDCETEIPKIRLGWATAGTADAPSTSNWLLFQCPVTEACANDGINKCRAGHTGELCNVCQPGYGFEDKKCEPCSEVNSSPVLYLVVFGVIVVVAGVAYARHNLRAETSSSLEGSLQVQLTTDNPLSPAGDAFASAGIKRQSLSMTTVQKSDDAAMLLRVLWQPIRILVGYVQVVNQIGLVLDITFPPYIQALFGAVKLVAVNLKDVLHLDCIGIFSFYTKWSIRVFGIPLTLLGIAALHFAYVRRRGDETAMKAAAGNLKSNAFFILFVVYRAFHLCQFACLVLPVSRYLLFAD